MVNSLKSLCLKLERRGKTDDWASILLPGMYISQLHCKAPPHCSFTHTQRHTETHIEPWVGHVFFQHHFRLICSFNNSAPWMQKVFENIPFLFLKEENKTLILQWKAVCQIIKPLTLNWWPVFVFRNSTLVHWPGNQAIFHFRFSSGLLKTLFDLVIDSCLSWLPELGSLKYD